MSQVKNEEELFERIEELQEEMRKLVHDYVEYIAKRRRHKKKKKKAANTENTEKKVKKSIAQVERENDTQCMAELKTGKRCQGKKLPDGTEPDFCKRHNNPKFIATMKKVELPNLPPPQEEKLADDSDAECSAEEGSSYSSYEDSSEESEKIAVKLSRDADGDMVDQEGNIWSLNDQKIIGKKDLRTKQKVWYKTV